MPKVSILWGSAPEIGQRAATYEFGSQLELEAFLFGVEEMSGWLGYREVKEGYVYQGLTLEEDDDD